MAAAAVAGRSHAERGEPCQDYAAATRGQEVCAIALADGAGSALHARQGALAVVSGALKLLRSEFHELLALEPGAAAERIVGRLQAQLARHAARRALAIEQLASTLLFAASDGDRFLCGQLGDGRIACFDRALGKAEPVFEPHKGEFFNQTVFLTSPRAAQHVQLKTGSAAALGGFALLSDGSEESLYNRAQGAFAPALLRMASWLSTYSERRVKQALDKNLTTALRERTGDDVSIALLRFAAS